MGVLKQQKYTSFGFSNFNTEVGFVLIYSQFVVTHHSMCICVSAFVVASININRMFFVEASSYKMHDCACDSGYMCGASATLNVVKTCITMHLILCLIILYMTSHAVSSDGNEEAGASSGSEIQLYIV